MEDHIASICSVFVAYHKNAYGVDPKLTIVRTAPGLLFKCIVDGGKRKETYSVEGTAETLKAVVANLSNPIEDHGKLTKWSNFRRYCKDNGLLIRKKIEGF